MNQISVKNNFQTCLSIFKISTYANYQEVKPAPRIGEVFSKSIRQPFQKHLQYEDVGKHFIGIFQNSLYSLLFLNVYVFKGLKQNPENVLHCSTLHYTVPNITH